MNLASGVRIGWSEMPVDVRAGIEGIVGGRVVEAVSQPGGFSPGTADRVRTADGRRVFVKAVSSALNDHSPVMHRREGQIAAALPESVPAPRFLGRYDDGHWIALVFEDVEGRHPATPWLADELRSVLVALETLAAEPIPVALTELPTAAERTTAFDGWNRIQANPPADLDPWIAQHLAELCIMAERGRAAASSGNTLVHLDLRADNLLLTADGTVRLVDWPWACRGAPWLDAVLLLINVRLFGGHDVQLLLTECAAAHDADPADLLAVIAALGGYFVDVARLPAPEGLPTIRNFQRAQAAAVLGWLREELF